MNSDNSNFNMKPLIKLNFLHLFILFVLILNYANPYRLGGLPRSRLQDEGTIEAGAGTDLSNGSSQDLNDLTTPNNFGVDSSNSLTEDTTGSATIGDGSQPLDTGISTSAGGSIDGGVNGDQDNSGSANLNGDLTTNDDQSNVKH